MLKGSKVYGVVRPYFVPFLLVASCGGEKIYINKPYVYIFTNRKAAHKIQNIASTVDNFMGLGLKLGFLFRV